MVTRVGCVSEVCLARRPALVLHRERDNPKSSKASPLGTNVRRASPIDDPHRSTGCFRRLLVVGLRRDVRGHRQTRRRPPHRAEWPVQLLRDVNATACAAAVGGAVPRSVRRSPRGVDVNARVPAAVPTHESPLGRGVGRIRHRSGGCPRSNRVVGRAAFVVGIVCSGRRGNAARVRRVVRHRPRERCRGAHRGLSLIHI